MPSILLCSLEFSTLQLFFDLYFALPSTLSPHAIACLVQLASVRYGNTWKPNKNIKRINTKWNWTTKKISSDCFCNLIFFSCTPCDFNVNTRKWVIIINWNQAFLVQQRWEGKVCEPAGGWRQKNPAKSSGLNRFSTLFPYGTGCSLNIVFFRRF